MTEEELKEKAQEFLERDSKDVDEFLDTAFAGVKLTKKQAGALLGLIKAAYIIGAKENGVVWHDLQKNPHDVPLESSIFHEVLDQDGMKTFWDNMSKCWKMFFNGNIVKANAPLYWCEIPKFEEE